MANLNDLSNSINSILSEDNLVVEVKLRELVRACPTIVKRRSRGYNVSFRIRMIKKERNKFYFTVKKPGTKKYNVNFEFFQEGDTALYKNAKERERYWRNKAEDESNKNKKKEYLEKADSQLDSIESDNDTDNILDQDVRVSCNCGYWRYWGPDYNARENGYSLRKMSNLQPPDVRDPNRQHNMCKHIYAASKVLIDYIKSSKD